MFQFPINAMIAIVAIPGDIIGSAILWKEYNSLAPSILAASTSAGGITDKMYSLKMTTVRVKAAHPGLRERMQKWIDTGVLVVENESGLLFTYGHLLGLRAASICVALGSMFADPNANVYGAYADPEHLARRIETATRIAMRAAELLEGSK